ncbi:MAG: nickel-dependent hydrogenase large subunit [Proteobacteria bacterium]|nr:nickel-dependent hydrogenase large subunit [Pseudomonadota bacterium]
MSEPGKRLIVGPFNRVEGDLEVRLTIEEGRVARAEVVSTLFRGFERMLSGRDPLDALVFVPRICGICSVSQSVAAARALNVLSGKPMPINGERALNLVHAAENAADHLTHFNLFFMPDFTREAYVSRTWHGDVVTRFAPGSGVAQRAAVKARAELLHIMGILAGHWPHSLAIQPGGVTKAPDAQERVRLMAIIAGFRRYLEAEIFGGDLEAFLALESREALAAWCVARPNSDLARFMACARDAALGTLGVGTDALLSAGAYDLAGEALFAPGLLRRSRLSPFNPDGIVEDVSHAHMVPGEAKHPFEGETRPDGRLEAAGYTFCKAPRLDGHPVEVGALARQVIDGQPLVRALFEEGGANVETRVMARLVELARLAGVMDRFVRDMNVKDVFFDPAKLPEAGQAAGFCEAARGTLGHWMVVKKGVIANYQIIAPTTWNFSPRDAAGIPGPLERALVGTPVTEGEQAPVAVQHIVRSYDPCMVCTVH